MADRSQMVEDLFAQEEWEGARAMLLEWVAEEPESHWLLTRLGTTYYEEKQYEKALEYDEQALELAPECPLVLWDYAGTLDMLGREEEAIRIWKRLIRRGVSSLAHGECGEGIRWARSLVNDSRYRVGLAYADLGRLAMAKKFVREHIAKRDRNTPSIYNLREVKKHLAKIEAGENPRPEQE